MINFGDIGILQLDTVVGVATGINFPVIIDIIYIFGFEIILMIIIFKCKNSAVRLEQFASSPKELYIAAVFFSVSMLCLSRQNVFIYFNF